MLAESDRGAESVRVSDSDRLRDKDDVELAELDMSCVSVFSESDLDWVPLPETVIVHEEVAVVEAVQTLDAVADKELD